jgi:hypothetical protein
LRETPRFEKARRPQPFVDAQAGGSGSLKGIGWNLTRHGRIITRMPRLSARPSLFLLILLVVLLSACASKPGPNSRNLGVLQLHETLRVEPDAATVRLQYGRIVANNAVQEHDPFCVFELNTVRPDAQTVPPGQFDIVAVSRSVETFAGMPVLPFSPMLRRVSFGDDSGPTHIYYKTTFRLRDAQRPVRALTCMSNQNAPGNANFMRHLTLSEIRAALGSGFTLRLER